MIPKISKVPELREKTSTAYIFDENGQISHTFAGPAELSWLNRILEKENTCPLHRYPEIFFYAKISTNKGHYEKLEEARRAGSRLFESLKTGKAEYVQLVNYAGPGLMLAFLEGLLLSGYSFSRYKSKKEDYFLKEIFIRDETVTEEMTEEIRVLTEAVFYTRDWVNEPLSWLTARKLSEEITELGEKAGFSVEVYDKGKIQALKMGGLLAVNRGSPDPPTFTVLEWNPENAVNRQPLVLAGKGIVFDTGGLSLKPTPKSMDYMKCDMAGAAVVASVIYAVAKNRLPLRVIGLIPATDNRPDGNAFVPGDVITLYDGTTVEIKNTDAEGRLILADALAYAKKYAPLLVIDLATLTGAAEIIAGNQAAVGMGNSPENIVKLKSAGFETYERIIDMPLWEEFAKSLKSDIADLNNLGIREGQSVIAGKFLEYFTDYPWVHLDIAGVSFASEGQHYIPAGGTGFGTRLVYNFLKKFN